MEQETDEGMKLEALHLVPWPNGSTAEYVVKQARVIYDFIKEKDKQEVT